MPDTNALISDLASEHASLDAVVAELTSAAWSTPTPAKGWDVRDGISHLCFFDEAATLAIRDPGAFESHKAELIASMTEGGTPDVDLGRRYAAPGEILDRWRRSRRDFLDAATTVAATPEPRRVPWYGPPMSLTSFTTARLMETWAHGVDIRDGLGIPLEFSPRLRHCIDIGVRARRFSFAAHQVPDPGSPVAVAAGTPGPGYPLIAAMAPGRSGPDPTPWLWGDSEAPDRIEGPALDLALVFTQRRHHSRTGVTATGAVAKQWLEIAQAFAGPPTLTDPNR